jgi:hypothetical protein
VLGAVFLTVTGAEALTADMGHFGAQSRSGIGWFALVFPALALNYLGQGAYALNRLEVANGRGPRVRQPRLVLPDGARQLRPSRWSMLATLATDHRQPGGDHRRLFADPAGDPARPAAAAAHPPDLAPHAGSDLSADRSTGCCSIGRAGAGAAVPLLLGDGGGLRHRGDRHDGRHDLPRLHRRAASLALEVAPTTHRA